jgi:hypothetical protein
MVRLFSRIASLLIAGLYVLAAALAPEANWHSILTVLGGLAIPLSCIWFPEALGGMTGYVGHTARISTESPPGCVAAAGWFMLVGVPLVVALMLSC